MEIYEISSDELYVTIVENNFSNNKLLNIAVFLLFILPSFSSSLCSSFYLLNFEIPKLYDDYLCHLSYDIELFK